MKRDTKGQAAVEFLMTYGWAILAAVIVIGVLAYFGVFSPGRYAPQACAVTAPFYCNAWNVKASAGVTVELRNSGGEDYSIASVAVTNCGTNSAGWTVASDGTEAITVTCVPALTEGNNFKGDVTITYKKSGSEVELTSTGSVSQKVTA